MGVHLLGHPRAPPVNPRQQAPREIAPGFPHDSMAARGIRLETFLAVLAISFTACPQSLRQLRPTKAGSSSGSRRPGILREPQKEKTSFMEHSKKRIPPKLAIRNPHLRKNHLQDVRHMSGPNSTAMSLSGTPRCAGCRCYLATNFAGHAPTDGVDLGQPAARHGPRASVLSIFSLDSRITELDSSRIGCTDRYFPPLDHLGSRNTMGTPDVLCRLRGIRRSIENRLPRPHSCSVRTPCSRRMSAWTQFVSWYSSTGCGRTWIRSPCGLPGNPEGDLGKEPADRRNPSRSFLLAGCVPLLQVPDFHGELFELRCFPVQRLVDGLPAVHPRENRSPRRDFEGTSGA